MGAYELGGEGFEAREGDSRMREPSQWGQDVAPEEWRQAFLAALEPEHAILHDHPFICSECGAPHHKQPGENGHLCECLECECERAAIAAFADSINTGFYVNSYTTKQCPTMEGVLENLRQGLERLEEQRSQERETLDLKRTNLEETLGRELTKEDMKAFKGKSVFAETMRTINRLSSSYRRCYWKSGAEMIFPILYGHMTFASHRCWTVYVKKGVFQAAQAWRRVYGRSIRHAAIRAGGGEIIQHLRQGMDPYPL